MKKQLLLAAAAALLWPGLGIAQNFAPAVEMYLGPSVGRAWVNPGMYTSTSLNPQTGTTYTVAASDFGKILTFANGSPVAVTLPVATTASFPDGGCFGVVNVGAGTVTITPATSTINGQATKAYTTGIGGKVCRVGANYLAE